MIRQILHFSCQVWGARFYAINEIFWNQTYIWYHGLKVRWFSVVNTKCSVWMCFIHKFHNAGEFGYAEFGWCILIPWSLVIIQWSIIIDHWIERVSISINLSQNLASIMNEIKSKKDVFWHVFLDIFWLSFSPKTVPENVWSITYLAAEIASAAGMKVHTTDYDRSSISCSQPMIDHENPSQFLSLMITTCYVWMCFRHGFYDGRRGWMCRVWVGWCILIPWLLSATFGCVLDMDSMTAGEVGCAEFG